MLTRAEWPWEDRLWTLARIYLPSQSARVGADVEYVQINNNNNLVNNSIANSRAILASIILDHERWDWLPREGSSR